MFSAELSFMLRKLIKEITLVVFITASFHLGVQLYKDYVHYSEMQRLSEENVFIVTACRFGPPLHLRARFYIELSLIVALIGSRLKGLSNTFLSIIGLAGAVISYIFWWQYIFRLMRNAETTADAIPNLAYLAGGNILDVVLAAMIGALTLLNVAHAATSSFRINTNEP
jgi:hypothetical protein